MSSSTSALSSVVAVEGGLIEGVPADSHGVRAWLGVPYAAAPVGALRWRPPRPVAAWHGVRPARTFARQCLQPARSPESVYAEFAGIQPMSENCLHLNVWSAAPDATAAWPVMVWIHGGAFQQGAGSNPVFVHGDLPRQGVVLVTLNYRLGPFGFMAHPDLSVEGGGSSGNYGLLDQVAALRWVQRHIAAFGGDPAQVTVFGQSAGAGSIIDLMAARSARGLFARAIAQSFGVGVMKTRAEAERSGEAFAARLGTDLAGLRALDGETLLRRYVEQPERWMPIVDGTFIEASVIDVFRAGKQAPVPLLTGWNADEGTTFAPAQDRAELSARLAARFGARAGAAAELYPATDDAGARAASLELIGDELFAWGVWRAARDHARIAPTWLYHFDHAQPFGPDQAYAEASRARDLGVFHSSEYPYVFGTTAQLTRAWGPDDRRMTRLMQDTWLRFAKTADPNGPALPEWPRFDDAPARVMRLAPKPMLIDVPRQPQLAFADR